MPRAPLYEIFSSIQGEGLRAGEKHCFVRFAGCNLSCDYCDTKEARHIPENARIEQRATRRVFLEISNPVGVSDVLNACLNLDIPPGFHDALAITGGEPLQYTDFLIEFLTAIKKHDWNVLLETNGTLPDELKKVVHIIDTVSMDIKLESATGHPADFDANRRFLEIATGSDIHVKLVVVEETRPEEIETAAKLIAGINSEIPLIIQPCTNPDGKTFAVTDKKLEILKKCCMKRLSAVKIIPQLHRLHSIP
ncbi:MAG: 7-carboxy-7-deazaguanine synthase QueE [Planctomycetota bacterium]